jgi:hypothetical protein
MENNREEKEMSLYENSRENNRLLKENNRLLKKLYRAHIFGVWMKIIFNLIIIGAPLFLYQFYLKDIFHSTFESYSSLKEDLDILGGGIPLNTDEGLFEFLQSLLKKEEEEG